MSEVSEDALLDLNEDQNFELAQKPLGQESQVLSILKELKETLTAVDQRSRRNEQALKRPGSQPSPSNLKKAKKRSILCRIRRRKMRMMKKRWRWMPC